jgi:tetratricopeptide (TPR) repeat protein
MEPDLERDDSLLFIHDGQRAWVEGADWSPQVADLAAQGNFRRCEWCEPVRLQARQLLECVVAARALRLTKLAEEAAAFLSEVWPGSTEAAALRAHDRPIQLAAEEARLRAGAAAGDVRLAVEAARTLLREDAQGRFGREAGRFLELVNAAAAARIARAEQLLEAGDMAAARREVAPVALAIPEDARLVLLLDRCDDLDTLRVGRRALDEGQLRRARLMAEAVLARDPNGVEAKAARQLLDELRASAKSRTDRANRLLDAGDADSARDELAPVLQAFPDDPAALAAWNRARQPAKAVAPKK